MRNLQEHITNANVLHINEEQRFPQLNININKSVFSLVNSAVNKSLPAFAAERCAAAPLLSMDVSCLHGSQQQTHHTPLLLLTGETDRQTGDRRTPDH